jgi:hypothetical protein
MANSNAVTIQLPKYCDMKLFASNKPILSFRTLIHLNSQLVAGTYPSLSVKGLLNTWISFWKWGRRVKMLPVFLKTFPLYQKMTLFLSSVEIYHACSEIFGASYSCNILKTFEAFPRLHDEFHVKINVSPRANNNETCMQSTSCTQGIVYNVGCNNNS